MTHKLFFFFIAGFLVLAAHGQIGEGARLGLSKVLATVPIAQSVLPRCTERSLCSTTEYIFTGNGLWTDASNWRDNLVPPVLLPAGKTITINPLPGGECRLTFRQTIADGATLVIQSAKLFKVSNNLLFLKN